VAGIQSEPELILQPSGELGELGLGHFVDIPAVVAHQMHVLMRLGGVARRAVPEMGMPDEIETFEQVQRAVDRGDVDGGGIALDVRADPLWGGVHELVYGVEHELALGGHPHPPVVQRSAQGGVHVPYGRPERKVGCCAQAGCGPTG